MSWTQQKQDYIDNYLNTHSCVDCNEDDPIVLEFDHVRGKKINNIGRAMRSMGMERLIEEIEKCDIRCANCHTRRHNEEE
jgi:hypothetical protein